MTGTKNAKSLVVVLAAGTEGKEMEHCVCTACLFLVLLNQNQSNRDSMHNFITRNSFSFEKTPNKTALFCLFAAHFPPWVMYGLPLQARESLLMNKQA